MFKKIKDNQIGLSLIELVIAVSIFGVIMLIASDAFLNTIRTSRESVNEQNVQDHARFLYEMMLKEIKMAQLVTDTTCSGVVGSNRIYKVTNNETLSFKNYHGQCVTYTLDKTDPEHYKLTVERTGNGVVDVFPKEIDVNKLSFNVVNLYSTVNPIQHIPPSVTVSMELQSTMWQEPTLQLQSTVAARYLE